MRANTNTAIRLGALLLSVAASRPAVCYEPGFAADAERTPLLAKLVSPEPVRAKKTVGSSPSIVLANWNQRRAAHGLPPLRYDPVLSRMAEQEAAAVSRMKRLGHARGAYGPGRGAGVGRRRGSDPTGRRFNACYAMTTRHRHAGAAAVVAHGHTTYACYVR